MAALTHIITLIFNISLRQNEMDDGKPLYIAAPPMK